MNAFRRLIQPAALAVLFTACSGIDITSPAADDAVVVPDAEGRVRIAVSTLGWELAAPGECGDRTNCGHLVVRLSADEQIDANQWQGFLCGETEVELSDGAFTLDLDTCPRQTGLFSILLHLHNDEHAPYEGGGVADFRRFIVED